MHKFFEKFSEIMERILTPIAEKLTKQPHVLAVRNALMGTIPIVIIGGVFLILAFPPVDPKEIGADPNFLQQLLLIWYNWSQANIQTLLVPVNMSMGLMAVVVAIGIGYHLATIYKLDPLSGAVSALISFLVVAAPTESVVTLELLKSGKTVEEIIKYSHGAMPTVFLDAKGMFAAMIIGLLAVEVAKFCKQRKITITLPEGVPPAVARSFEALIPTVFTVIVFYCISLVLQAVSGYLIPQLIMKAFEPLVSAYDSALSVFICAMFVQLLWFVGLHGAAIVGSITQPFSDMNLLMNVQEKMAGVPMTHVYTTPLWAMYVAIGGCGATLALLILLLRSRSEHLKAVGKVALLPGIFNINEPIIFGVPMVLNSYMAIPFILVQGINGVLAFWATKYGLIGKAFVNVPWTMPAPLGAFFSTLDWRAGVFVLLLIAMDFFLYLPFFKMYEKSLLKQESAG
ncbi:MAG: PTS transporter subunit EIIC [Negativicutes bacterium]|jgi:PTS system cellobiose-specific IIC component